VGTVLARLFVVLKYVLHPGARLVHIITPYALSFPVIFVGFPRGTAGLLQSALSMKEVKSSVDLK
jgi:hypothetical protein